MSAPLQDDLKVRLSRASSRELLSLIDDLGPKLSVGDARRILRNPFATGEVVEALAAIRQLMANYDARNAIARYRRTPETLALRFISGLYWRDLLEVSVDVRISPAVRGVAEKYLIQRLDRLATGEKVTLARRATADILAQLRRDPSLQVIQALLNNPRLTEPVLLPMVANEDTLPRILDLVARNPRWGTRYEIRVALSLNSRSPFRVIFDILPTLRRADQQAVADREDHSSIVRHRARELLGPTAVPRDAAIDP